MSWTVVLVSMIAGVLAEMQACLQDWEKVAGAAQELFSQERTEYGDMFAYSGHWLNDVGRFEKCKEMSGTQYVVLEVARRPWVFFAACGPDSCTKEDYYVLLRGGTGLPFIATARETKDPLEAVRARVSAVALSSITVHFPFEYIDDHSTIHGGAVAMLIVIIFLLVLCLTATVVDLYLQSPLLSLSNGKSAEIADKSTTLSSDSYSQANHPLPLGLLLSFSFYTNFNKLIQPTVSRSGENLAVLNGVRVLSIGWVILGHVYAYRVGSSPIANIFDIPDIIDKPKFAIVYGAFYAVDTFFWLGGFLVAYLLIKEIKAKGRLNWFMVYFHRFWRLVPLFMFVTFLVWAFQGYGQEGPLWFKEDDSSDGCAEYWWTNLLFINNFVPDGKRSYCLAVAWYMSNDMQFYLITPVILYVYVKIQRAIGWIIVCLLCMISVITAWEIAVKYDLNMVLIAPNNSDYMYYYYVKPYCRVAPYALGLASGFILCELKQYEKSSKIWDGMAYYIGKLINNVIGAWVSFVIGLFLITLLIFVQYDVWKHGDLTFTYWSRAQNIQFIAWNRLTYGFGMSCLMLPILLGHIKPAEWFLSLPIWSPLAKLTFSVYLIHLSIVDRFSLGMQSSYYLSDLNILKDLVMFVFLAYLVGMLITLTVESPMMALEKVLFHPKPRAKRPQS
jgi:peptidoglycan/LPS O-acetylase OafA/YrhL